MTAVETLHFDCAAMLLMLIRSVPNAKNLLEFEDRGDFEKRPSPRLAEEYRDR